MTYTTNIPIDTVAAATSAYEAIAGECNSWALEVAIQTALDAMKPAYTHDADIEAMASAMYWPILAAIEKTAASVVVDAGVVAGECVERALAASPVHAELERVKAQVEEWKLGVAKENYELDQVLGKALGYPWLKDDQKNFTGATEADGVCTGEHVPITLAMEVARELATLREKLRAAEEALRRFIYETTHLSPEEDDGSHCCKITKNTLWYGRETLTELRGK